MAIANYLLELKKKIDALTAKISLELKRAAPDWMKLQELKRERVQLWDRYHLAGGPAPT